MSDDNTAAVIAELRARVAAGRPGDRLPSVRDLVARHRASPVTVQRAISRLAAEGLLTPRPGRGTFVADRPPPVAAADLAWQSVALGSRATDDGSMQQLLRIAPANAIPLSGGYVEAALQPVGPLGAALARAARRPDAWERGPVEGREELRAWFAREAGGQLTAHDVVICPGGQAGLATAMRALTDPGDVVLVEAPTYVGALAAARAAGLRPVPVPADQSGVRPELLAEALERTGARLAYLQPLYANPSGAVLAAERRAAVLDAAHAASAFVIEDDWGRDLQIDGPAPQPLVADDPAGHVVYIRSLTKSAAPGLRIACVAARGAAGARLRAARIVDDFFVAGPLQEATLELVASPAWRRHRRRLSAALRERRDALGAALGEHAPELELAAPPLGGLHLWARLPDGSNESAIVDAAAAEGVVVFPGRPWFCAEPPGPHLRLTFGGAPPAALAEGARRLARALATTARG